MKAILSLVLGVMIVAQGAEAQQKAGQAPGAVLRVLEKVNGQVFDFDMANGETQEVGRLTITLKACRYPADNPTGDAYAFVSVSEKDNDDAIFQGWMIASSPALNAMEHHRYDVWVLRCRTD